MTTLFLSHSHHDKGLALDLEDRLLEAFPALDVWTDLELRPGRSISRSIETALDNASLVALLWTAAAAASRGVAEEIELAQRRGKDVIPCFYEPDVPLPPPLTDTLGIDFTNSFGLSLSTARAATAQGKGGTGCSIQGGTVPTYHHSCHVGTCNANVTGSLEDIVGPRSG